LPKRDTPRGAVIAEVASLTFAITPCPAASTAAAAPEQQGNYTKSIDFKCQPPDIAGCEHLACASIVRKEDSAFSLSRGSEINIFVGQTISAVRQPSTLPMRRRSW
jgi:hypothetical protein